MLCDILSSYGIELQDIFHRLLCAGLTYLAASAADTLQSVRLLGSIAEDMHLSATGLVPCGKLNAGNGLYSVSVSQDLCP